MREKSILVGRLQHFLNSIINMPKISSNSSVGRGNTNPPPYQISCKKKWVFTLNNYTEEELSVIRSIVPTISKKYHIGFEVGESGTPHLQGAITFNEKCRPISHGMSKRIHWQKMEGTETQAMSYCAKEGHPFMSAGFVYKPVVTIKREDFYDYQEELVKIFEKPCPWDDRTIYWRYGDVNIGKTQFAKWLCVHLGAVVIGGSSKHMLAQVQNADAPIYIVLLSYGDEKVAYRAIEQVKDGLFTASFGCDNNKMTTRNASHIIVLGNEPPDTSDRNFHPTKYNVEKIEINPKKNDDDCCFGIDWTNYCQGEEL